MTRIKLQGGFDELAFLEFFCEEPKKSQPSDGYWCYEVTDSFSNSNLTCTAKKRTIKTIEF